MKEKNKILQLVRETKNQLQIARSCKDLPKDVIEQADDLCDRFDEIEDELVLME